MHPDRLMKTAELRSRATELEERGDRETAAMLRTAAFYLDEYQSDTLQQHGVHVIDLTADQSVELADMLPLPVVAEIEATPDPIYGHTFKWPFDDIKHHFENLAARQAARPQ